MERRFGIRVFGAIAAALVILALGGQGLAWAQDDGPTASLRVVVVRDTDGKPKNRL